MRQVQVTLEQRPWFNPDLNGRWFFVPGVIGTLTLVTIVNLTAFADRARARGRHARTDHGEPDHGPPSSSSARRCRSSLSAWARWRWSSPSACSGFRFRLSAIRFVLLLGTALFLLSTLALGLLISTVCSTQQQAFSTNFFVLSPFFILSGFAFPISSMPQVLQWFTYINPLRYYLVVIRGTFLKGRRRRACCGRISRRWRCSRACC